MNNSSHFTESVVVAFDYDKSMDHAILLVGTKAPGHDVRVIKTLEGREAKDIWTKLYPDAPKFA